MTDFQTDAEIARLAEGFLDLTLPKEAWTHTAHFAAALWLLTTRGAETDADGTRLIREYGSETEGYHETITIASLRAAEQVLKAAPEGAGLAESLQALMAGPFGKPDWILAYWSKGRLFTPEARLGWIEPDLAPLPF